MDPRKKNSPYSQSPGGHLQSHQNQESACSIGRVMPSFASEFSIQTDVDLENPSSVHKTDHRTLFHDPMEVRQWVVASATGSTALCSGVVSNAHIYSEAYKNVQPSRLGLPDASYPNDYSSHFSLSSHARIPDVTDAAPVDTCIASAGAGAFVKPDLRAVFPIDTGFADDGYSTGGTFVSDGWTPATSHSSMAPLSTEMMYSTSSDGRQHLEIKFHEDLDFETYWTNTNPHGVNAVPGHAQSHDGSPLVWNSMVTTVMEPSVPSSFSPGSFFPRLADSPVSFTTLEDLICLDPIEESVMSPLSIGGPIQIPYPSREYDTSLPSASMLKPRQVFPRPPLPNNWHTYDHSPPNKPIKLPPPPMLGASVDMSMYRRVGGEVDHGTARCNALYQAVPQVDDFYHCPFEVTEGCGHKPDKLKCNYDKHLDSHLKPYRCKFPACGSVPFSSTACLLRHEREAHGMHGHGDKPYLCTYTDCERSYVGSGFPRRWNLQDHMKRVHSHANAPSSTGSCSPGLVTNSPISVGKDHPPQGKRRSLTISLAQSRKRTKSIVNNEVACKVNKSQAPKVNKSQAPNTEGKQRQIIQKQWIEQHAALRDRLESLRPTDTQTCQQLAADYERFTNICRQMASYE